MMARKEIRQRRAALPLLLPWLLPLPTFARWVTECDPRGTNRRTSDGVEQVAVS
jgi:hypothetical protein